MHAAPSTFSCPRLSAYARCRNAETKGGHKLWPQSGHNISVSLETYPKSVATLWPQFVAMFVFGERNSGHTTVATSGHKVWPHCGHKVWPHSGNRAASGEWSWHIAGQLGTAAGSKMMALSTQSFGDIAIVNNASNVSWPLFGNKLCTAI